MLDTNIVSDLVRNPAGKVARKLRDVGEEAICVSIIVAAELRFGVMKNGSPGLKRKIEGILARVAIVPLEAPADVEYAMIRQSLEARGAPIGPNDFLIAAHALALGLPLVTSNTREFSRVSGLALENWLE